MKKLLSFVLCLILCLPAIAMAEDTLDASQKLYTVDFGTFTIDLADDDYYEVAEEMLNNAVYAIIYPAYDDNATTHPSINIVWSQADASAEIEYYGPEKFAQLILDTAKPQFEAMNIKMTDAQVLSAEQDENAYISLTYSMMDYTAAGVDLVTPQYQMQVYSFMGEAGTYVFTLTASTMESLEHLIDYLDRIYFK